ncbi:hypothetical protein MKW94_027106 [Papaver nudicaule]|uniref:TNase-like domain-containing protein n=1 Tax=Papaver nudicaule TaxID=74823 RepID=A0AA41SJ19_PAPNU|nr:hypothetical protein [Papaver nudicaule]
MGNALRFLFGNCFKPQEYDLLGHHGVSTATVGVSALAHDLFHFDITSQVPEKLSGHVASSMEAQTTWYVKLLQAWKGAKPPPRTPEQASRLVIQTLDIADVEGLLKFYGLPILRDWVEVPAVQFPPPRAEGVKFVLQTFRVDPRNVAEGSCIAVYVNAADPREAPHVPKVVQEALSERLKARANLDYAVAEAFYQNIVDAGYRLLKGANHEEVLAKKYGIRLRGIDAPKYKMPYGEEAKNELTKLVQGKRLTVHVYGVDPDRSRLVGDVYCNGLFVQEVMLKKGCAIAWRSVDQQRPELIKWEMEAKAARVGLWALSNPDKPCEWRNNNNPEMPWDWRIPISNRRAC